MEMLLSAIAPIINYPFICATCSNQYPSPMCNHGISVQADTCIFTDVKFGHQDYNVLLISPINRTLSIYHIDFFKAIDTAKTVIIRPPSVILVDGGFALRLGDCE